MTQKPETVAQLKKRISDLEGALQSANTSIAGYKSELKNRIQQIERMENDTRRDIRACERMARAFAAGVTHPSKPY